MVVHIVTKNLFDLSTDSKFKITYKCNYGQDVTYMFIYWNRARFFKSLRGVFELNCKYDLDWNILNPTHTWA